MLQTRLQKDGQLLKNGLMVYVWRLVVIVVGSIGLNAGIKT
jgi:hypothetical protein